MASGLHEAAFVPFILLEIGTDGVKELTDKPGIDDYHEGNAE